MKTKHIALLLCLCVLAACLSACSESAAKKYEKAQTLMSKEKWEEAGEKFADLGSYEDAAKLAAYCKAAAKGEAGEYDAAISDFTKLGDFKESLWMITYYQARQYEDTAIGGWLINWGNWINAAKLYDSISVFRDSTARAEASRKTAYDYAVKWASEGDYDTAVRLTSALGTYKDCYSLNKYYEAFKKEAEGDYAGASAAFAKLGSYKDAAQQVNLALQRGYDAAAALEAGGEQDKASKLWLSLGDYQDSFERAYKPYYEQGVALREAQDWIGAVRAFAKAGNYSDAAEQILATYYAEGEAKRAAQDWYGAVEAFGLARAHDYGDAAEQVLATRYAEGEAKRAVQDWDGAAKAFEQAGAYSDAAEQVLATRYAEGEAKRAAGDWDGAATAFELAGEYSDAPSQVLETRYQQATALNEAGEYAEAYAVYLRVIGYKDVDSILQNDANIAEAAFDAKFAISSYVSFGTYPQTKAGTDKTPISWIILAREGHKALLISQYGLDRQQYYDYYREVETTWAQCTLRNWLNEEFLNTAFTEAEQRAILVTAVDNSASQCNSEYSTNGGANTNDRVFLLSCAEAMNYFADNDARLCKPTEYAVKQGVFRLTSWADCTWWLRSPGYNQKQAAVVDTVGRISINDVDWSNIAVRPAMWVDLDSGLFQ